MRRNRRNNAKKERIIMIASSAFVLTALTMTGIYMKSNDQEQMDDGYTIDFTAFDDNVDDKMEEIQQESQSIAGNNRGNQELALGDQDPSGLQGPNNDLDYFPMEVGSGQIEIPGLTDRLQGDSPENEAASDEGRSLTDGSAPVMDDSPIVGEASSAEEQTAEPESDAAADAGQEEPSQNADSGDVIAETLHFSENDGLLRPVSGEILIPFSMNTTVYFSTLDQFKCNPGLVMAAETGSAVLACARARVIDVFENEEIGQAVTMELGDGYQITYGQLEAVNVTPGSQVEAGEVIGWIAEPTKYYCVEGSNLYLKLTSNGTPVNPETLFQ